MAKLKLKDTQAALRLRGITLRHKDGEYRVNLHGGTEATASYTTDLQDALDTGLAMVREWPRHARTAALEDVAQRCLGFTLEERRSDALDFHQVGVWSVRAALLAAYQAGEARAAAEDRVVKVPWLPSPAEVLADLPQVVRDMIRDGLTQHAAVHVWTMEGGGWVVTPEAGMPEGAARFVITTGRLVPA